MNKYNIWTNNKSWLKKQITNNDLLEFIESVDAFCPWLFDSDCGFEYYNANERWDAGDLAEMHPFDWAKYTIEETFCWAFSSGRPTADTPHDSVHEIVRLAVIWEALNETQITYENMFINFGQDAELEPMLMDY